MNTVTIKLRIEEGESPRRTLSKFLKNMTELIGSNFDYEVEAIIDQSKSELFFGLILSDKDLKNVIDASPANSFEVRAVSWSEISKQKRNAGATTIKTAPTTH